MNLFPGVLRLVSVRPLLLMCRDYGFESQLCKIHLKHVLTGATSFAKTGFPFLACTPICFIDVMNKRLGLKGQCVH